MKFPWTQQGEGETLVPCVNLADAVTVTAPDEEPLQLLPGSVVLIDTVAGRYRVEVKREVS